MGNQNPRHFDHQYLLPYLGECENADRQKAEQTVRNLTNLSHLSLSNSFPITAGCPWVTDDMVKQISTLKHLLFLNLYNTNVTNSAAIHLQAATQLRALHIGGTKMRGQAIIDITKSSTMVKKLGLRGLGKSSNPSGRGTIASLYLMKVGVNLPFLTHLDIAGCDQL